MRELDEEIPAYQKIYEREHAIFAKYHKELAYENDDYEAAKLHCLRANRDLYSYLAKTDFNHGSNADHSEFLRITKAVDKSFAEEHQAAHALQQAKRE